MKAWSWKGNQLAAPHTIARRLCAFPFVVVFRVLYCAAIFAGWGAFAAKLAWSDTR